jgi:hypothetical protein
MMGMDAGADFAANAAAKPLHATETGRDTRFRSQGGATHLAPPHE